MPTLTVDKDNWWDVVEAARKHAGKPNLPAYVCLLHYYNVCMVSVVDPLSVKLWSLYRRIRGTHNETYHSFWHLPAFWVNACEVMEAEIDRIELVKAAKQEQENAANQRRGAK